MDAKEMAERRIERRWGRREEDRKLRRGMIELRWQLRATRRAGEELRRHLERELFDLKTENLQLRLQLRELRKGNDGQDSYDGNGREPLRGRSGNGSRVDSIGSARGR